jgi:hypothetical protein
LELATLEFFRLQLSVEILDQTVRVLVDKFHWPNEDIIEVRAVLNSTTNRVVPHVRLDVVARDPMTIAFWSVPKARAPITSSLATKTFWI